jgi:uncharacterized protein
MGNSHFDPGIIKRPDPALLKYYILVSLLTGPLFPIALLPLFFKYETLRYHFDQDGISMSWGILFRREVYLTYRRIQDIHLTRNIIQRWLGLSTVAVQTASGSATPEMSIEGVLQAEALRDHLYSKMRGAEDDSGHGSAAVTSETPEDLSRAALQILTEIRDTLQKGPGKERDLE